MKSAADWGLKTQLKRALYAAARLCPVKPRTGLEATEVCRALSSPDLPTTLGKLSRSGDDPARIVQEYQEASNSFKCGSTTERFYLSLKPPALRFDLEYAADIVATARQNGHAVHFDAHALPYADPSLRLLEGVMQLFPAPAQGARWSFGLTLPSRWKRSLADARWVASKGIRPRLVKGDFKAGPADEVEPGKGYLALVDLVAGEVPEIAVATHDYVLAREALTRCLKRGAAVQLELFFGMPSGAMLALARELGVPVRFYVPFGDTLLIYLVRDLVLNPHKILRRSAHEIVGSQERKLARIVGAVQHPSRPSRALPS